MRPVWRFFLWILAIVFGLTFIVAAAVNLSRGLGFVGVLWALLIAAIAGVVAALIITLIIAAASYRKAGPNEVLVVSGGGREPRLIHGGGTIVWPVLEQARSLSLELMNLEVRTPEVYTVHGVPVAVDGVAQVKIGGDAQSIVRAAELFLSRERDEIMKTVLQVVEGHMRAVLGRTSIEDLYTKRQEFADEVKARASRDLDSMGMEIVSLTVRNISDPRGYLEALGRPRTAQVKRDALIGEARADEEAKTFRYEADTRIEEARRDYEIRRAEYEAAISQKRAEADLAYDLQRYKTAQEVKREEVQLGILEKELQTELARKEVARKEEELLATVIKPAEAERKHIELLALAEQFRREAEGRGDAEAVRVKGMAEAETMERKAAAWAQYNQAAVTEMFVNILPKMAEAVAAPLAKTERIVIVSTDGSGGAGASRVTQDIAQVIAQLPPVVESLTGVKLEELLKRVPGLKQAE